MKHRDSRRGAGIARDIHDLALRRRRVIEKGNVPRTSSILPLVSFHGGIANRRIVEKLDFSTDKPRAPSAERREKTKGLFLGCERRAIAKGNNIRDYVCRQCWRGLHRLNGSVRIVHDTGAAKGETGHILTACLTCHDRVRS